MNSVNSINNGSSVNSVTSVKSVHVKAVYSRDATSISNDIFSNLHCMAIVWLAFLAVVHFAFCIL